MNQSARPATLETNGIGNWKLSEEQFLSDLRDTLVGTANDCRGYGFLCEDQRFDPSRDLDGIESLARVPYVTSATFKRSSGLFPDLIRVPFEALDLFTASSSTSGDPSLAGRRWQDVEDYSRAYLASFERYYGTERFARTLAVWPSPEVVLSRKDDFKGKPVQHFAPHILKGMGLTHDPARRQFLLRGAPGGRPDVDLDVLAAGLREASAAGERTLVSGPPHVVYPALAELEARSGETFRLGENGFVMVGAGGWDGKKGVLNIGRTLSKANFVEDVSRILGIPRANIADHYGFSESAAAMGAHYVESVQDFVYHVPPWARVLVRDPFTLECIHEPGREGLLEMLTPYGMSTHAGAAVLVDDLVSFYAQGSCPDCGHRGQTVRIHGRAPNSHKSGCGAVL